MKKIIPEAEFSAEQLNNIAVLSEKTGLCEQTVQILYGRGVDTEDKIKAFINPGKHRFLSPLLMSGMKEAVSLITRARDEEWSVVIYGDYDADGICASTILCRVLDDFGIQAAVCVPERKNGYGLSIGLIDEIFDEYCPQLFITVDCGISNAEEVEYIKEQGAEVIVTDHHELPDKLPDCIVINPKIEDDYPYDNLCGAGVAFKLGCALIGTRAYGYIDFAAIATVADSVPLTGENRDIVAEGLKVINASPRKNYANFLKRDEKVTSQSLAFSVAPKINAAGRMGNANAALRLFLSDDEGEIYDYSVRLTSYNMERQKRCDELYASAKAMLNKKGARGRVIALWQEGWNAGFVGIVAARLAEEYCRPALLFVKSGDTLKGSVRSVDGVNIYEALKSCGGLLEEFGGHSQAAGVKVSVSNLDKLESELDDYLRKNYTSEAFTPSHMVNGVLNVPASPKFVRELDLLEPYGVGNRKPQFVAEATECRARLLKEGASHLSVKCNGLDLIYFSGAKYSKLIKSAVPKQIVYEFVVSHFRGREQLQGFMRDVVYKADSCDCVAEEVRLDGITLAAEEEINCNVVPVTRAQAQAEINDCGEYGTVFLVNDAETLKMYDRGSLELNVFTLSSGNLCNAVVLSPATDCDLSGYENVVFLDKPARITLPSLAGKTVKVCTEIDGFAARASLDCDRDALLSVFRLISSNPFNLVGDSMEEIARGVDAGVPAEQVYFALKVFEELGLISYDSGKINIIRGVKTQLTNSEFYNFVNKLT